MVVARALMQKVFVEVAMFADLLGGRRRRRRRCTVDHRSVAADGGRLAGGRRADSADFDEFPNRPAST